MILLKCTLICILFFTSAAIPAIADEIYLKDNKIIKGSIITLAYGRVEFATGMNPFLRINFSDVYKIRYDNGKEIYIVTSKLKKMVKNYSQQNIIDEIRFDNGVIVKGIILKIFSDSILFAPQDKISDAIYKRNHVDIINYYNSELIVRKQKASVDNTNKKKRLWIESDFGYHNETGRIGLRFDYNLFQHLSYTMAGGMGSWGGKFSGGVRLYTEYPYWLAFGLSVVYNTGFYEYNSVFTINTTALFFFKVGTYGRMYIEIGKSHAVNRINNRYSNKGGIEDGIFYYYFSSHAPYGPLVSLGYSIGI